MIPYYHVVSERVSDRSSRRQHGLNRWPSTNLVYLTTLQRIMGAARCAFSCMYVVAIERHQNFLIYLPKVPYSNPKRSFYVGSIPLFLLAS